MKRKKAPPVDKQRVENVNQWIENNLYPSEKYPQQGEKVAKKKFVDMDSYQFGQNDELMNTRENLESMNERENLSKGMPNYCVDISSQQVMKTQSKDMVFEKNEEEQLSNLITIEKTDNIDEKTKVFKTETFSENNVRSCEKEEVHVDPKLLESVPLDLKASDSGFTDTLVNALREKLCQSCQGVLIDVLKQTYFTRYEQIAEIHLQSPLTTQPSSNVDTRSIDEKDHTKISKTTSVVENNHSKMCKTSSVNGNDYSEMSKTTSVDGKDHSKIIKKETTSLKKIQKPKKLEVTDLLYEKTNKENLSSSDSLLATGPGNTVYDNTEAIENNGMQKLKRLSSPKKSPPCEKAIILAKNDNFKGTQSKTSPNNHTAEIKTKGKMVSSDKSKTNGKVLPKSEPRLCQQNPKHVKTKQGVAKVDEEGKHPTSGEDEEYKLPHLKDNPFIKKDKLGKSNSEHNQKSENSTKKFMIKRSMSLNIDSSKVDSQSSSKSLSPVKKTSEITGASEFAKTEDIINGKEKNEIETLVNETYKKKTETGKELESKNNDSPIRKASFSKKHSPKSPKKPSMFDHLNFAKEVCGNIGEPDNIDKKLSETENSLKTKEPPELNKIPLRSKTPPRKKKFSPFGDVIDDRDLSPEEAHGVPIDDDEIAPHRINLINWDPTKLLNVLYTVKLEKDTTEDISHQFVNMEGLMEKLPMNKKKATLLKTWKRRFFRAKDGWLHYYEGLLEDQTSNRDKPSDSVQLMGGKIEDLGNRVLGVDDGRGRFLMVRCPTEKEYGQWKLALESQTVNNVTYVRPVMSSPPHPEKKVIIIDIGSGGIRAGVMGAQPCLPQMFFPSVVARHKTTQELVIGIDAYKPEIRKNSTLIKLVEPSNKVDKFAIDMEMMSAVFDYIFKGLKADSAKYWIMLSTPYKLGDAAMSSLMKILTDRFNTKGVCMVMQSLLALYSYNATSGIIVDIGERMEILPIFDGVLIEGGVSRQSYGGQKIADSLNSSLVEHKYNFVTPVDKLLVRYVMEQSCYVCENYKDMKSKCDKDSDSYKATVYLNNFDLPEDAHMSVTHDISCFKSAEGFFNTDLWGMDYPCVHKLIYQAIQSCPMDNRKHMYRAIYLSGGVTMLPGFSERLQAELKKLAPPSVLVEVHASPQRYYSAFIGAGTLLSNLAISEQIFISSEEWKKDGAATFRRWKAS